MTRAMHGAPPEALRQALNALSQLSFRIAWTADPDLAPPAATGGNPDPVQSRSPLSRGAPPGGRAERSGD